MTRDDLPNISDDALLAVNAWLSKHNLSAPYHKTVIKAGELIAKAYEAGELYQGRTEPVLASKSAKAGDVSVSKTYATGANDGIMGRYEMMALDLIKPFTRVSMQVLVNRY